MSGLFGERPRPSTAPTPRRDGTQKFLFRSRWGESLGVALRVREEGHQVKLAILDPEAQRVGDGLIDTTAYTPDAIAWADVVVFDCTDKRLAPEADRLLAAGTPCLGSSSLAYRLEKDRAFATDTATRAGLRIPEWHAFSGARAFDEALRWMDGRPLRHGIVFKANRADVPTQVADDRAQMARLFDYLAPRFEAEHAAPDFILQAVVEGTEVSTEAWFDGERFSLPNGTLERNKLMAGDLGEKIGSAGEVVWCYDDVDAPLVQQLLLPFAAVLRGQYRGPFDVNAIIDPVGVPYWLEFTPRFGYGAINSLIELVPISEVLLAIAHGSPYEGPTSTDFAAGVLVHVPPYPIDAEDDTMAADLPINGWEPDEADTGLHPMEMALDDRKRPITSGPSGAVCNVTATAPTIEQAMRRAYSNLSVLHIPKMRYRNDLGPQMADDYQELQRHHLVDRRSPTPARPLRGMLARR